MSKLIFRNKPTQEEIQNFIDLIDYNRSQRNKEKDFLMKQFESGDVFVENNKLKVVPFKIFLSKDLNLSREDEFKYTNNIVESLSLATTNN
jgi:hypothetical protein